MARSSARNEAAPVRLPATSPPQQFAGAQMGSCANPSPPPHFFSGGPTISSVNPSTPPHFYPGAAPASSSSAHSLNQWTPLYTPAPPMHMYNFHPPPVHHHEQGNQRMENLHFVGTSPDDTFSTLPPPPHPKAASQFAPAKVNLTSSKRKRKNLNVVVVDDEPNGRTAQRLPYTPEEHVRLANAWLECSTDPIDGNGKKGEKFWDDIATLYNCTTPNNRKRDYNQLKQEWQRVKKRLGAFHGAWTGCWGSVRKTKKFYDVTPELPRIYICSNTITANA